VTRNRLGLCKGLRLRVTRVGSAGPVEGLSRAGGSGAVQSPPVARCLEPVSVLQHQQPVVPISMFVFRELGFEDQSDAQHGGVDPP
jgi:hypothetical protein